MLAISISKTEAASGLWSLWGTPDVVFRYGRIWQSAFEVFPFATLYHAQPTGLFIHIIAQTLLPIRERASLHIPDHSRLWMCQWIISAQETADTFFSKVGRDAVVRFQAFGFKPETRM